MDQRAPGTFLKFDDGPMAARPPLPNPGPWPPPDRIAVYPGRTHHAVIRDLPEGAAPEGAIAYRQVSRSRLKPGPGKLVGAHYAVDGEA